MNPEEVKNKWPKAYNTALIQWETGESPLDIIKALKKTHDLSLEDSKRILSAINYGISLEEHQEKVFETLKEAAKEIPGASITDNEINIDLNKT